MDKKQMTEIILDTKMKKEISWSDLATATGLNPVCVAAACLGSASLNDTEAAAVVNLLELGIDVEKMLKIFPLKGEGQVVPSDPLIYRLFEIAYVYGPSIKEITHEKFGDGIMSAIDFTLDVDKVEDPKGDRVQITMTGKFLPYKKW
ncbi:cyanase [Ascidiimonas sp. W6]|uniref:cyanase n=1 Tax=Ascidiimonas meishanensis TaxID=3128903 RepID=UPI0030ECB980